MPSSPFLSRLLPVLLTLSAPWGAVPAVPGTAAAAADVTVLDHGDGTVTLANGIISILIETAANRLDAITYTTVANGQPQTVETLMPKEHFRWGGFPLGGSPFVYTLAVDPAATGGAYGDVMLRSTSTANGVFEVHYALLRGSSGFYACGTLTHRVQDGPGFVGAWGALTWVPTSFTWTSINSERDYSLGVPPDNPHGMRVPDSAHEMTVMLTGGHASQMDDKFMYAEDRANLAAWGWSSVGPRGANVGVWMMSNLEFSDGGPLKRDVALAIDRGLDEPILTGEVGMGGECDFAPHEVWSKTCGPYFYYVNSIPRSVSEPRAAAQLLYRDALAQARVQAAAWPYAWFKQGGYVPESGRGTVAGTLAIADPGNPHASCAGIWVGLERQPSSLRPSCDFQKWAKPYQYWVRTRSDGSFTIPHVIAGSGYTLWAFGPGAAGTFLSQPQTGGRAPFELDLPAATFAVTVAPGRATELGTITWMPQRIGATVFELGVPNRTADKFRHGEDYWVPEPGPKLGYPSPIWGGEPQFSPDHPHGLTYRVGESQWPRDWSYILPALPDHDGVTQPCLATIRFTLPAAPTGDAQACVYMACAGDEGGGIVVSVDGSNLGATAGVHAAPQPLSADGFDPPPGYSDDSAEHCSDHGPFFDERIVFPGRLLHAGDNTLSIAVTPTKGMPYLMLDYLRLELAGYVPPAPDRVTAVAGNGRILVAWPVVAGATSYQVLRRTLPGSDLVVCASDVSGPVCGSGSAHATYTDVTAVAGTAYAYAIRSVDPAGMSLPSPPSPAVTPEAARAALPPPPPTGLAVVASGHHRVALQWADRPGTAWYQVRRTTLHDDGVGGTYPLRTIILDDAVPSTTYVDTTPSDGRSYAYDVEAVTAAGISAPSPAVQATPLPPPPAIAPGSLTATWIRTRAGPAIRLHWTPVAGAEGYVLYRISGTDRVFTWPQDFLTTFVETTYTDLGSMEKKAKVRRLDTSRTYAYQVTAVNAGGVSPPAVVQVPAQ